MDKRINALKILHEGTIIPAIPLALDSGRQFDTRRQRALMRYYLESGVGGIAAAVHTTQFEIRNPAIALFEPVLKLVAEEISKYEKVSGRTIVKVAGVCGPEEQATLEAHTAKKFGYDAVLLSPGGLSTLSEDDLLNRTRTVAAIMPVIGFYLQTAVGGRQLSFDYWRRLSEIDNVVAIKCASFSRYQTLDLIRGVSSSKRAGEIALYTGNDDNIVIDLLTNYVFQTDHDAVEKRFVGGLLGHWSIWTKKAVAIYENLKSYSGKKEIPSELLTLAPAISDCNAAVFDAANGFKGCIAGIHEILCRQGLMEGIWCLDPKEMLSPGQSDEIDRICRDYPYFNDDEFVKANLSRWLED